MTVQWTRGSPDLLVVLDRNGGRLGIQIQDQLRSAIRSRRLGANDRLPSTRQLSEVLQVSRGTIVDVYEQLLAEGYIESRVGSGTRVAAMPPGVPTRETARIGEAAASSPRPTVADFEYGIPDLRSVPLTDWSWAVSEATRSLPTTDLGDGDPAGSRHLREVITAYHRRARSGCAVAEDAIVVAGFRQGLTFALATLARHGIRRIALEDPGPRDHDVIARRAGLDAVAVPVDDQGLDVAQLHRSGAQAVLLTPAHQCPTGVVLSPSRRRELVAWAEEVDGVILEDDYDAEFRYDRQPIGSLQGLDSSRVIALGSVSKTLAPAFRLGWVLAPAHFVPGIIEEKRLSGRGSATLDHEALALLMETGRFDRHLRRVRDIYRARRDALVAEVERAFGPGQVNGSAAGCHVVLRLPEVTSEPEVVARAATMGVRVNGIGHYRFAATERAIDVDPLPPALVIGFGNVSEHQIGQGIRVLAEAARTCTTRAVR